MKKAIIKGTSLLLATILILLTAPLEAVSKFDFKSAFQTIAEAAEDLFKPPFILTEMETIAINYGGEQYDGLSLSTQSLRMGVGDSEEFFVNIEDENGNPVENFTGLSWNAYPSDAVSLEVNPEDTRFCTVTILETDAKRVTITASAYGQTLTQYIDIIGNGVSFSSSEYYILVDSDNMVVSFDMSVLSMSKAIWTVNDEEYSSISGSDYEFISSDSSVLRVTGKSHSRGIAAGIGQKEFYLYPEVYGVKEGTVTLTVNAGQDSDTCTVHVVPLKEYKIEAYSEDAETPLADAEISTDIVVSNSLGTKSLSGKTDKDGIIVLKLPDVERCPAFDIYGSAVFHPEAMISSKDLIHQEINRLPMQCKVDVEGLSTSSESISTLSTNLGDKLIDLINFETKIDLKYFDVALFLDDENGELTIKGSIEGATTKTESTFDKDQNKYENKKSYNRFKSLFKGFINNDNMHKHWENLKDKVEAKDASLGISAQITVGGYIELKIVNGKVQFHEGGFVVGASAKVGGEIPVKPPTVYVAYEIKGGFDVGISIVRVAANAGIKNSSLGLSIIVNFDVDASIGIGATIAKVAGVEVGLEGNFNIQIDFTTGEPPTLKQMLEITAKINGYLEYYVQVWILKWGDKFKLELLDVELYPEPKANLFPWESKSLSNASFEAMTRDYLYEEVVQTQSLTAEMQIMNTYPNGAPQIEALNNGKKVAVWLADNGIKSSMNRTTLMYSFYNGNSWSEPEAVYESGRLDGNPQLCSDGENAYVLWLRGEEIFSDNISFEEYLAKTELVFSSFNGSSWSTPVTVGNSNDRYQLYYSIAANDGDVTISWTENDENDAFLSLGNTSVYQQNYVNGVWETPVLAVKTNKFINTIASGYINGSPKVAYSMDADGDFTTVGDSGIYVNGNLVTPENEIDYLGLTYNRGRFYFSGNNGLCTYDGKFIATETYVNMGYMISSYENSYAMVYCLDDEDDDFSNELYVSYSEDGINFTDPVRLTSYNNNIKDYDFVVNNNGSLTVCTDLRYLGEDAIFAHTDFIIETFEDKYEVELVDANFDVSFDNTELKELTFEAVVKNQSTKTIDGFEVYLIDSNGKTIKYKTHSRSMASGEVVSVEFDYTLPADYDGSSLTLKVVANKDTDLTNNSHEFNFKYADVVVEDCKIIDDGYLTAVVTNNGHNAAGNVNVKFYKFVEENEELYSLDIGNLDIGESVRVEYQIPDNKIVFNSYLSDNIFEVEATTSSGELNYANNEASAIVSPVHVTGINIKQNSVILAPGDVVQLGYDISPVDATDKTVYWFSSDDSIVSVDGDGNLTARKLGTATITAVTSDGRFEAGCRVTVSSTVPVSGVEVQPGETSVLVGTSKQLTANVLPLNATDKTVYWSTSNSSIATVSDIGVVTGKTVGTVVVTARTKNGNYQASCVVTVVTNSISVTGVEIDKTNIVMEVGDTDQIKAIIKPANATNTNVTWSTNNTNISVNQEGKIAALKPGVSTVSVVTEDGAFKASCVVTVRAVDVSVTGVSVSENSVNMEIGETKTLVATVSPSNATNKNVVWLTSDDSVVQVDSSGKVFAVGVGNATITVRTEDGSYIASCDITVKNMAGHGKIETVLLNSAPYTTSYKYKYNEKLDLSGLTLKVIYADGSSEIITDMSKVTVSELDSTSTGNKTIDVTYEGYTVSFDVEVKYTIIQWIIMILLLGWIWY